MKQQLWSTWNQQPEPTQSPLVKGWVVAARMAGHSDGRRQSKTVEGCGGIPSLKLT